MCIDTDSSDKATCTRADKCLPAVLVDLAISAGVESTLPVRPACRTSMHYTAASQLRSKQGLQASHRVFIVASHHGASAWAQCRGSQSGTPLLQS